MFWGVELQGSAIQQTKFLAFFQSVGAFWVPKPP